MKSRIGGDRKQLIRDCKNTEWNRQTQPKKKYRLNKKLDSA